MPAPPELRTARRAYASRSWAEAYDAFGRADALTRLGGSDLWSFALAAALAGHDDDFFPILERAHAAFADQGDNARAARCAFWLGFRLAGRGEVGPASGWLGRAARLVEREGAECVERGYLLLPAGFQRLGAGDADAAWEAAAGAAAIGERFDDADLLTLALHLQGRTRLHQARVAEGLALLDEAMVGVVSGRLSPVVTGLVYCSVIGACRSVYELRRAREWTAALGEWCREQPELVAFSGECLAYRSEILNLRGDWRGAIAEAQRVCDDPRAGAHPPGAIAAAYYQCGEAHRMLGELAAAEECYRNASRQGREPQPGLALLRLAQGDATGAAATLRRAVAEARDPLQRARLLPALCEILLELDEIEESEAVCAELEAVAERFPADALGTMVAFARGATLLARGDAPAALIELRAALGGWQALEANYEAARTRALIGRACRALGDHDSAELETDGARAAFESLGAAADLARLDGPGPDADSPRRHGLTQREAEVLAVIATGRSNRAAAAALGISEKTVARHLSNIFGKLGVSSRAAATAYAYEHDLQNPPA